MLTCGNVGKTYATERGNVVAVRGIDLDRAARRVRRDRRPLRLRQVVADGDDRRIEPAQRGNRARRRRRHLVARRRRPHGIPQPPHRLRVPVREPAADAARRRQCRAAGTARPARRCRRGVPPGRRAAGAARPRGAPRRLPGGALLRTAAARGDRARPHQRAFAAARRRADLRPRRRDRSGDHGGVPRAEPRRADDLHHGHPQSPSRRAADRVFHIADGTLVS